MDITQIKAQFQFRGNTIRSISLTNNFVTLNGHENLKRSMDTEYEIIEIEELDNEIQGVLTLKVLARVTGNNDKKFEISILLEGFFVGENMDIENFTKMLVTNGSAALYSIARAQILSLSSQSLAGGEFILPMVNFFKAKDLKVKEKQSEQK